MKTLSCHKEVAAHLRSLIAKNGIKAKVRMLASCGSMAVQINAPAYGVDFTEDEQRTIRTLAKVNGLTLVRGMPIDLEQMTNPATFDFHIPATKQAQWRELALKMPNPCLHKDRQPEAI